MISYEWDALMTHWAWRFTDAHVLEHLFIKGWSINISLFLVSFFFNSKFSICHL